MYNENNFELCKLLYLIYERSQQQYMYVIILIIVVVVVVSGAYKIVRSCNIFIYDLIMLNEVLSM